MLELHPGSSYAGDGVYALEYARPNGTWRGLRRVRQNDGDLEILEGSGEWSRVTEQWRDVVHLLGMVRKVFTACGPVIDGVALAA